MQNSTVDLRRIARRIMLEHGFRVDFPDAALGETGQKKEPFFPKTGARDLTGLFWSSIDNDESRDLDQIEFAKAEPRGTRLYVAIANVSEFVPVKSALDQTAAQNTTSIYTGVATFPLLPERLSTDLSSLLEGQRRLAIVIEMLFAPDGEMTESTVYPAVVMNNAQLAYNATAAWLEGQAALNNSEAARHTSEKLSSQPELQEQLRLQDKLAQTLDGRRHEAGALQFVTTELRPQVTSDGHVELHVQQKNRATDLIENFMIAANQATVQFLKSKNSPTLQRVVRTPQRWDRIVALAQSFGVKLPEEPDVKALQRFLGDRKRKDPKRYPDLSLTVIKLLGRGEYVVERTGAAPIGHFGLALNRYAHSTAPNRRYPDILTQRLVLAACANQVSSADVADLESLARHCTEREDEANKVERAVRKSCAAVALSKSVGQEFPAIVTGSSTKGVWVRINHPPVEGRLVGPRAHLEVGDAVRVRLVSTDPERGYIDFQLREDSHR